MREMNFGPAPRALLHWTYEAKISRREEEEAGRI